jgi:hypothetical protein
MIIKSLDLIANNKVTFSSKREFARFVRNTIVQAGEIPEQAKYDDKGNCLYCGESGRCPQYHTRSEIELLNT